MRSLPYCVKLLCVIKPRLNPGIEMPAVGRVGRRELEELVAYVLEVAGLDNIGAVREQEPPETRATAVGL